MDPVEPVNLGNPEEITVNALLGHVLALTGSDADVVYRPLPVDDRRPDISRAQSLLGWEPTVELTDGLAATCAWFAGEIEAAAPAHDQPQRRLHIA